MPACPTSGKASTRRRLSTWSFSALPASTDRLEGILKDVQTAPDETPGSLAGKARRAVHDASIASFLDGTLDPDAGIPIPFATLPEETQRLLGLYTKGLCAQMPEHTEGKFGRGHLANAANAALDLHDALREIVGMTDDEIARILVQVRPPADQEPGNWANNARRAVLQASIDAYLQGESGNPADPLYADLPEGSRRYLECFFTSKCFAVAEANQGKLAMDDLAGVAGLAEGLYDELLGAADGNTGKLDEILAKLANSDAKDKHEILIDRARAEIISYRLEVWLDTKQPSSLLRQTAGVHLTTPVLKSISSGMIRTWTSTPEVMRAGLEVDDETLRTGFSRPCKPQLQSHIRASPIDEHLELPIKMIGQSTKLTPGSRGIRLLHIAFACVAATPLQRAVGNTSSSPARWSRPRVTCRACC